jgi:hypothetical protein
MDVAALNLAQFAKFSEELNSRKLRATNKHITKRYINGDHPTGAFSLIFRAAANFFNRTGGGGHLNVNGYLLQTKVPLCLLSRIERTVGVLSIFQMMEYRAVPKMVVVSSISLNVGVLSSPQNGIYLHTVVLYQAVPRKGGLRTFPKSIKQSKKPVEYRHSL